MRIDPASDTPIFQQIASAIRESIAAGVYRPGDAIPSIRATALHLLVNPNTVARAYDLLEREGLVASERGVGMIVARRTEDAARARTIEGVESALAAAVRAAERAGLDRRQVDAIYRRCWAEARAAGPPNRPPSAGASTQPDSPAAKPKQEVTP